MKEYSHVNKYLFVLLRNFYEKNPSYKIIQLERLAELLVGGLESHYYMGLVI